VDFRMDSTPHSLNKKKKKQHIYFEELYLLGYNAA
jgi:hypothetical protein